MESRSDFWDSYRNGVALGLGLATVYLLILLFLGWLITRHMQQTPPLPQRPGDPPPIAGKGEACLVPWQT